MSASQHWDYSHQAFYVSARDLSSSPHVCSIGFLPTKPSPPAPSFAFKDTVISHLVHVVIYYTYIAVTIYYLNTVV